ncbi:MAG: bifunctional pyr operon transcriptional regulator/uracil phosphoribosyltransferase PyrR [Clostridia bacterium]
MQIKAKICDEMAMTRALTRIAHEIIEHNHGTEDVVLIGIHRRGVPIANIIEDKIFQTYNVHLQVGSLNITLYRDDLTLINPQPILNSTDIPFDVVGKNVILIDDVLFTGRTVRAAIDAIMQLGRPKTIQLAVMVDRGHRELPIRADYVGKNLPTAITETVAVNMLGIDTENSVLLYDNI